MKSQIVPTLIGVLAAHPAFAHPGHGAPGWWHHGELLVMAAVVMAATGLARRLRKRRALRVRLR
jgi:hypothetical protein